MAALTGLSDTGFSWHCVCSPVTLQPSWPERTRPQPVSRRCAWRWGSDRPFACAIRLIGSAGLLHGDLGVSAISGKSVALQVGVRSAVTFPLIVLSLAIALLIGLPLGCAAVLTQQSAAGAACFTCIAIVGGAVPALWGGLLLILLFSRGSGLLGLFPSQGFPTRRLGDAQGRALACLLVLPALATGITAGAGIMRYTRAALGDAAQSQAVSMAMACGMTRRQALLRVGLRLSLPQLVSVIGLTFAQMITGVMVVENLFALPGLGAMLVTDVGNRDLIAVQSELFLLTAFFLLLGLAVDMAHHALDPRLKNASTDLQEVL